MEAIINKLPEDINYMFYIKPKGAKRFSTYNPGKGTMGSGKVFTELYRKEHLMAICKWIAEDNSGEWVYQLRRGDGKKTYWQYDSAVVTSPETPQISTETAETVNALVEGEKEAEMAGNSQKPKAKDVAQMVKTELAKNKAMGTIWHIEFPDGTECDMRHKCTVAGCDFYEYTESRDGAEVFKNYKATACDITLYVCQRLDLDVLELPQSPETPQAVNHTTDTAKLAQTA